MTDREYSDKALRSFFGAREGGQDRPQDVNTPQIIIDAILALWPEGIELDPCSNADSIVPARRKLYRPEIPTVNGLTSKWPDFTYANPPYEDLIPWFSGLEVGKEHLMLVPVRTNRTWWCLAADCASRICWLKPFAFLGHEQAFPASLAMLYYGRRREQFKNAFAHLGSIGTFTLV